MEEDGGGRKDVGGLQMDDHFTSLVQISCGETQRDKGWHLGVEPQHGKTVWTITTGAAVGDAAGGDAATSVSAAAS